MSLAGDRIRELRIQNNMTLDDVAKYLGINRQAVYKYEQGIVTNIPLDKIEKMATLFNSTPDYIAGWSKEPPDDPVHKTIDARIVSGGIDKLPQLTSDEDHLLNVYRGANEQAKSDAICLLEKHQRKKDISDAVI